MSTEDGLAIRRERENTEDSLRLKKSVNSDLLSNVNEINRLSGTADEREQRLQKKKNLYTI